MVAEELPQECSAEPLAGVKARADKGDVHAQRLFAMCFAAMGPATGRDLGVRKYRGLWMRARALLTIGMVVVSQSAYAAKKERATLIVVDKSDHLMQVYAKEKIIATYRVGFGTSPMGHKQSEGDRRTPEGRYTLDYKNAKSTFFKSIHISYPNKADKAKKLGVSPGGEIMIHGEANDPAVRTSVARYGLPD